MQKSWIAILAGLPLIIAAAPAPMRPLPQAQRADVVQVDLLGRFLEDSGVRRKKSTTRHRAPRASQAKPSQTGSSEAPAPENRNAASQQPGPANVPVPLQKPGSEVATDAKTRPAANQTDESKQVENNDGKPPAANPPAEAETRAIENPPSEKPATSKAETATQKPDSQTPPSSPNTAKSETPPAPLPVSPTVVQPGTATEPAHEADVPKPLAKPEAGSSEAADGKDAAKPDDSGKDQVQQDEKKPEGKQDEETAEKPASPPPPPIVKEDPEELKACLADLTAIGAKFEPTDPIDEGEGCGIEHPIDVAEALPGLSLGGATMRCKTALTMAHWLKDTVQPALNIAMPGRHITGIVPGSTYACRLRNNATTGKISEHARGNAFDVAAFKLDNGDKVEMKPRDNDHTLEGAFQKTATAGACLHFMTVLAPGSDAAHETHLHLDIMDRKGGYRICE